MPPKYATASSIVNSRASLTTGGRYNGRGMFEALYTSEFPGTAMEEVLGWYIDYGLDIADAMP